MRTCTTFARLAPLVLALAAPASAQPTATVITTANGSSAVTTLPGQPVRLAVSISHNMYCLAGIQGGTTVTGNAGIAGNFATLISNGPTVTLGAFVGGSRLAADIAVTPNGLGFPIWPDPPFAQNPMPVWQYDVTFTDPGTYEVNWTSPATAPNVRLYASNGSFSFLEAQTTYTGATITVLPTPSTLAPLTAALALTARRRRTAQPTEGTR